MKRRGRPPYPDLLTPREQEVLALLREGLSNDQIAERLGVSLAGAKYHVSEILGKLGVSTREEAAHWQPEARPWWVGVFAPIATLRHRLGWLPQLAIGAMVVALAAGVGLLMWGIMRTDGASTTPPSLTTTACPGGPTIPSTSSPLLAYTAPDNTVWVVDADGKNATQLICDGADNSAWSPSGRYISHIASDGTLRLLDVQSGNENVIDDGTTGVISGGRDVMWAAHANVLFYTRSEDVNNHGHPLPTSLWKMELGLAPSKVLDSRQLSQFWPSPDGSRVAYTIPSGDSPTPGNEGYANASLYVVNADGRNARRLGDGAFILSQDNAWSPDGHLLAFWKNTSGGSAMFGDVYILDLADGQEFKVGNVSNDELTSWSPNINRHVFHNWAVDVESKSAAPLFDPAGSIIDWSPDGNKVAFVEYDQQTSTPTYPGTHRLVVLDFSTSRKTAYETSSAQMWVHFPGYYGDWSPDSRYYAFDAGSPSDSSSAALYVADTTTESSRRVLDGGGQPTYSPDGAHLLIQQSDAQSNVLSIAKPDGSDIRKIADGAGANGNSIPSSWQPTIP